MDNIITFKEPNASADVAASIHESVAILCFYTKQDIAALKGDPSNTNLITRIDKSKERIKFFMKQLYEMLEKGLDEETENLVACHINFLNKKIRTIEKA